MPEAAPDEIDDFIERWSPSGGRERANYALFLTELCDVLGLPRPEPAQADACENAYTFDRAITHSKVDGTTAPRFIDLYKGRLLRPRDHCSRPLRGRKEPAVAQSHPTGVADPGMSRQPMMVGGRAR